MRTAKRLILALILSCAVVIVPGAKTFAGNAETKTPTLSNTRTVDYIVKITADAELIPLNEQSLTHLVNSSGVIGKTARDVLGIGPDALLRAGRVLEIEVIDFSPGRPKMHSKTTNDLADQMGAFYGERKESERQRSGIGVPGGANRRDKTGEAKPLRDSGASMGGYGAGTADPGAGMMGAPGAGMEGGGMMGMGWMGGGMGGMYGFAPTASSEQSLLVRLWVGLDEEIKPAAQEFAAAVVENLRRTLSDTYEWHVQELDHLVDLAERQRAHAEERLAEIMGARPESTPAGRQVQDALGTIVDLSGLLPEMSFEEAVDVLKHSVEPPLQIAVMWNELSDNTEIDRGTPINMEGLPNVKMETALKLLLKAVAGGSDKLAWKIEDSVIVIGTHMTLEPQQQMAVEPLSAVDVRDLAARRYELAREIQQLELELAGADARRRAIQEQIARTEDEAAVRLREDTVTHEMEQLLKMSLMNLDTLKKQAEAGRLSAAELAQANENVMKTKIELARRREELSRSAGGTRLGKYNDELSEMAIDAAEKRAQLELLRRQLAEVEGQWTRASTFDPGAARIRMAREALSLAENRVSELDRRRASLRQPTVIVIGAN